MDSRKQGRVLYLIPHSARGRLAGRCVRARINWGREVSSLRALSSAWSSEICAPLAPTHARCSLWYIEAPSAPGLFHCPSRLLEDSYLFAEERYSSCSAALSTSWTVMRPPEPVPFIIERSTPSSFALRVAADVAFTSLFDSIASSDTLTSLSV